MGYQVYEVGKRWGGYGVPTICEHPICKKEIDRGMSYACGGEPFSEYGCNLYFCGKHLKYTCFNEKGEFDDSEESYESGECVELCERCAKGRERFNYKPELKKWIKFLLTDKSWAEWRKENKEEVKKLKKHYKEY